MQPEYMFNHYDGVMMYPEEMGYPQWQTAVEQRRDGEGHTHGHGGATTCQDGHVHLHPGVTSTPIETEQGHVHWMTGNTTFDDGHIHQYETYTSTPIPLPGGYHTHYVEIRTTEDDGHTHIIKGFTEPSRS
ncbi:YmaF family protein [Sporosarcina sp. 179-K 3D1 HS]|uniref:YmaF family protein n=1 Tax=Sporosarcina sp. 179-K 3D1 HS TaxID=3232169 RepID=UPI0039A0AA2D